MTLIFNMDLDNLTKTNDYSFNRKESPHTFYIRLYQNGYDVDMSKFERLSLRIQVVSTGQIDTVNITKVATINGEKLIEITIDDKYLVKNDKLIISPTVRFSNKSIILKAFNFIIYDGKKTEMEMVKHGLQRLNHLYNLYIKAIKRDQINKPNGVIGLDSDGNIPVDRLPDNIGKHVFEKIYDTEVHGLRMNDKYMLEYRDENGEFLEMNSISGGNFTHHNQSSKYNIFGGFWGEMNDLHSPTIEPVSNEIVHGGKWNEYI